jgi:hypothetical protein
MYRPRGSTEDFGWRIFQYFDHKWVAFDSIAVYIHETSSRLEQCYDDESFWDQLPCFNGDYGDEL